MVVPNGVIFIWTGTNATIPAGWQRVTALDGKFPKGIVNTSTQPNTTGGSNTHSHTTTANHTHTMANHTHSITLNAGVGAGADATSGNDMNSYNHSHSGTSGGVSDVSVSSVSATYKSVSHLPPYYEVIYITPTTNATGLAPNAVCLYEDNDFTVSNTGKFVGYYECDGNVSNNVPDLRNKYLKGAGTGADAGGTGGATNHNHAELTHSHTQTHRHSAVVFSAPARTLEGKNSQDTPYESNLNHSHTIYPNANTTAPSSNPTINTSGDTVEPAYKKLLSLKNNSGTTYTPLGVIGMWLGTLANIPSNYDIISTMNDKHLKIANLYTEIGNTGGSNTHSHTGTTHSHTIPSHNHSHSNVFHPSPDWRTDASGGGDVYNNNTYHTVTIGNSTGSLNSATTNSDTKNNEPEYRTVAYIKLTSYGFSPKIIVFN